MRSRVTEQDGFLTRKPALFKLSPAYRTPEWRNWQTRRIQDPVRFTPRVGSSPTSGTARILGTGMGIVSQMFLTESFESLLASAREDQILLQVGQEFL